jgi:hypothetical protein
MSCGGHGCNRAVHTYVLKAACLCSCIAYTDHWNSVIEQASVFKLNSNIYVINGRKLLNNCIQISHMFIVFMSSGASSSIALRISS